jgi:hypothetical protein
MNGLIREISTHKAVRSEKGIDIILKGFCSGEYSCKDEILYTLPQWAIDDVDHILDRYSEDNRVNVNELNLTPLC